MGVVSTPALFSSWSFHSCERSLVVHLTMPADPYCGHSLRYPANTAVGVVLVVMLVLVRPQQPQQRQWQLHPSSYTHPPQITIAILFDHYSGYADLQSSGGRVTRYNSGNSSPSSRLWSPLKTSPLTSPTLSAAVLSSYPFQSRSHSQQSHAPVPLARRFFWLSFISYADLTFTPRPLKRCPTLPCVRQRTPRRLIYLELAGSGCTHK